MTERYRLLELRAENFKRIKILRIRPDGHLVRIEGRNSQGKSSALDAFMFALGGMKHAPEQPVRRGAKKAEVSVTLGDLVIERSITEKGSMSLTVTLKDAPQASPQKVLDRMYSDLTFDPVAFNRMKPQEQADLLRRMLGIDMSPLDAKRSELYHERRVVGRQRDDAWPGDLAPDPDLPTDEVSIADLLVRRDQASDSNKRRTSLRERAVGFRDRAVLEREGIEDLEQRIRELGIAAENREREAEKLEAEAETIPEVDLEPLNEKISAAESVNRRIRSADMHRERLASHTSLSERYEALTRSIDEIDETKRMQLSEAAFPYPGLSLSQQGDVTLNGVPFEQASSSEQLRASVAIGLAEHRPIRVMLVREGSMLDEASLGDLNRIAEEYDADILCERVSDSRAPTALIIEDGEVVE
jgi:hypothetical protein